MTGGLIQLVAYGVQDIFLTKDPQITYFKTVYRRHTNFSTEIIPQKFSTDPNFGSKVSATISRSGDLIRKMHIVFDLPSIPLLKEDGVISEKLRFAWVKRLGYALVKSVEIEIGGQSIDKQYGEWLHIWSELTTAKNKGLNTMLGDIPEITSFTDKKSTFRIYVPLQFWFCRKDGLALPILNLQYNEVKINMEINEVKKCYINAPKNYIKIYENIVHYKPFEYIEQNIDGTIASGQFIYFDKIENKLYYNRISKDEFQSIPDTIDPGDIKTEIRSSKYAKYNILGIDSKYESMPIINTKEKVQLFPRIHNLNIKNCFLLVEYIYLDEVERLKFIQSKHEYLIEQIQYSGEKLLDSTYMRIKLGFSHPCKEVIWVAQSEYLTTTRNNDHFNFTNSYKYKGNKYIGNGLILNQTITLNGHDRVSRRDSRYFSEIQPYQNHNNSLAPGIFVYSFCLYPEIYQPSGPCNMSKIDNMDIQLKADKSIILNNAAKLRMYAVTYNILRISNGLSGIVFTT